MLTEETIRSIGTRVFEQRYTADRIAAVAGLGFLRWGEPLVNAFARVAEVDDRGKAFAVEVQRPTGEQDREPWIAFCFDVTIAPGPVDAAAPDPDGAFRRAVQARTEFFLPTTVERVWWLAGLGECRPHVVQRPRAGTRSEPGQPPGALPRTDRSLGLAWRLRRRPREGTGRRAQARPRDPAARRRTETKRGSAGTGERHPATPGHATSGRHPQIDVMAAVEHALAHPVFSLDSCGAVFITWVYRP